MLQDTSPYQPFSLASVPTWWEHLRDNEAFDYGAFEGLAIAYALLALVAAVQLFRISARVPEYGWTTQKVFHLLNLLVCLLRSIAMGFRFQLQDMLKETVFSRWLVFVPGLLSDLPGLLFFTTYTLLVLFWAEIYHLAKGEATSRLRPTFLATNVFVYCVQGILIVLCGWDALRKGAKVASAWFLVVVSVAAAAGFLLYGGRLVVMLRRFPLESRGRTKKMFEVGTVTIICTLCFVARAVFIALATVDKDDFAINVLKHPLLNIAFYSSVELVPAALVLYILRRLPPKRQPHPTIPIQPRDVEAQQRISIRDGA